MASSSTEPQPVKHQVVLPMGLRGKKFVEQHAKEIGCPGFVEISLSFPYSEDPESAAAEVAAAWKRVLGRCETFKEFMEERSIGGKKPLLVVYDLDAVLYSNLHSDYVQDSLFNIALLDFNLLVFSSACLEYLSMPKIFLNADNVHLFDLRESKLGPIIVGQNRYEYGDLDYNTGVEDFAEKCARYKDHLPRADLQINLNANQTVQDFVFARDTIYQAHKVLEPQVYRLLYASLSSAVHFFPTGQARFKITENEEVNLKWEILLSYITLLATNDSFSKQSLLKIRNGMIVAMNVLFRSYTAWNMTHYVDKTKPIEKNIEFTFEWEFYVRLGILAKKLDMTVVRQVPSGKPKCISDTTIRASLIGQSDIFIEFSANSTTGAQRDMAKHLTNEYYNPQVLKAMHDRTDTFVILGISFNVNIKEELFNYAEVEIAAGTFDSETKNVAWTFCPTTPTLGLEKRRSCVCFDGGKDVKVKNIFGTMKYEYPRSEESSQDLTGIFQSRIVQPNAPKRKRVISDGGVQKRIKLE